MESSFIVGSLVSKEEKARLEQEKREQDELQRKLNLQRMKEEEDERAQLAEQEKLLQEQVALKQRELDSIRAMEKKVQEDMESKVKSSPTPRGTGRRVELQEEIAEPVVGNAFGVQLKAPNPVKAESPVHTKSSVHTYDEQTLDDTEVTSYIYSTYHVNIFNDLLLCSRLNQSDLLLLFITILLLLLICQVTTPLIQLINYLTP